MTAVFWGEDRWEVGHEIWPMFVVVVKSTAYLVVSLSITDAGDRN
jgi:hypothetical protein